MFRVVRVLVRQVCTRCFHVQLFAFTVLGLRTTKSRWLFNSSSQQSHYQPAEGICIPKQATRLSKRGCKLLQRFPGYSRKKYRNMRCGVTIGIMFGADRERSGMSKWLQHVPGLASRGLRAFPGKGSLAAKLVIFHQLKRNLQITLQLSETIDWTKKSSLKSACPALY